MSYKIKLFVAFYKFEILKNKLLFQKALKTNSV